MWMRWHVWLPGRGTKQMTEPRMRAAIRERAAVEAYLLFLGCCRCRRGLHAAGVVGWYLGELSGELEARA